MRPRGAHASAPDAEAAHMGPEERGPDGTSSWPGGGKWTRGSLTRNVVIMACAVDAADKVLLPASFKAIDDQMHLGPAKLAALSFAQNIAFSLALPVWGSLMRYFSARDLMVCGCVMWSFVTFLLSAATHYETQFVLRLVVGAALASVNPLGQAMLCDIVPEGERGSAFGLLQSVSAGLSMIVASGTTAIASQYYLGIQGWRWAHMAVACLSLQAAWAVYNYVEPRPPVSLGGRSWLSEQRRVLGNVGGKPSFLIMVAQGVTGGIPWNAFAFLAFYFQLSGYTDIQAGQIMLLGGLGGVVGGVLGGNLGDFCSQRLCGTSGRCAVAQTSVFFGIVTFLWLINIPFSATSFPVVILAAFLFHASACWTPAAALRPICGEIFTNSHDRAQVLALWIALEGVISSFCGAPLVGVLSTMFGYSLSDNHSKHVSDVQRVESMLALRKALIGVSMVPWILCLIAWVPMYWTYPRDRDKAQLQEAAKDHIESGSASAATPTKIGQPSTYQAVNQEKVI